MELKNKICIISFDNWGYDSTIVVALKKKGINATHINIGTYKHSSKFARVLNFFSKNILRKNLKLKNRQKYIVKKLKSIGFQDQILVLNPELIELECHLEIKKHTTRYITYLYDSIARSKKPIQHLLTGVFDQIYSFDEYDVNKYGFLKLRNYICTENTVPKTNSKYKAITVSSFDERFPKLNEISYKIEEMGYSYNLIFVGKNINYKLMKYKNKNNLKKHEIHSKIHFQSKKIPLQELHQLYSESDIIIDLVRHNQSGLSFRIFEALGLQKKIITNNHHVRDYDFYNPKNILVIDDNTLRFEKEFFETPYEPVPQTIFNEYTLDSWTNKIFNLT